MKRKFLALLLALCMIATAFSSCGGDSKQQSPDNGAAQNKSQVASNNNQSNNSNDDLQDGDSQDGDSQDGDSQDGDSQDGESQDGNSEKPEKNRSESWVFYWYLCGSDLESRHGAATGDLEELMSVQLPENIKVVIEAGGSNAWQNEYFSAEHLTRAVYSSEGLEVVEQIPSANMGSPEVLADFLNFCNQNYPADKRAIIFWNHGGGSISGLAFDENFNMDSLQLGELSEVFKAQHTGQKYEIVGCDTCLMATIDAADTFDEYANYLVASEELEPGCGWSYDRFFGALAEEPSMDGAELGKVICDSFYAGCEDIGQEDETTLSVTDLSKVAKLISIYNSIGKEVLRAAGSNQSYMSELSRSARAAENYGGNNDSQGYTNMVDMGDLVRVAMKNKLLSEKGEQLLEALNDAIVYKINGPLRDRSSGLSCYYSYNGDMKDFSYFLNICASPAFSYYFGYLLTGSVTDDVINYANEPDEEGGAPEETEISFSQVEAMDAREYEDYPIEVTEDNVAVLNLGKEKADKLAAVYFNLAAFDMETKRMIYLGQDNDIDADWENGVFKDNFRGVWGSIDGSLVYMELSDETEDYQIYAVPILLDEEAYVLSVSYDYKSKEYKILGARHVVDENGKPDKLLRQLKVGDVIVPLHNVIENYEEDAEPEMKPSSDKIIVTEQTAFKEMDLGDGTFAMVFEMKDSRGQSFQSGSVIITYKDGNIEIFK